MTQRRPPLAPAPPPATHPRSRWEEPLPPSPGEPRTFLPHPDVLAHGDVLAPGLLDDAGVAIVAALPHLLQEEELKGREGGVSSGHGLLPPGAPLVSATHRLGSLDKDLAAPQLELVRIHVDGAQEVHHALPLVPAPGGPRLRRQDGVPGQGGRGGAAF